MMNFHFIDSSTLCLILEMELDSSEKEIGKTVNKEKLHNEFKELYKNRKKNKIMITLATLIETGHYISLETNSQKRKEYADKFSEILAGILKPESFLILSKNEIKESEIIRIIDNFPENVFNFKLTTGDLSIILEYDRFKEEQVLESNVRIWSVKRYLSKYNSRTTNSFGKKKA